MWRSFYDRNTIQDIGNPIETAPHFWHSGAPTLPIILPYWSQMDTNLLGECLCGFLTVKECIIIIPMLSRYAY